MDTPARIGRYSVERVLGQGGMGRVFLARDSVLGRRVAVKVLRDDLGLGPELREQLFARMRQEARAAAALGHPNMVTLHDMGEDERVGLFLVFEYIDGPTLRDRIAEAPLPGHEVARLARELGSALTHAHGAGVVHRDVKPENVMLAATGSKITDFGIARIPDSTLTSTQTVLGTPGYTAPEALSKGDFSPLSDQFSLAATFYEALSGKRAFGGDDALTVATRVATVDPPPFSDRREDARAAAVLARAMAKDKTKRFASVADFGNALATALDRGALDSFLETPMPRSSLVPRATRRWQNIIAAVAVLVIFTLVGLGRRQRLMSFGALSVFETMSESMPSSSRPVLPPPVKPRVHPSPTTRRESDAGSARDASASDAAPSPSASASTSASPSASAPEPAPASASAPASPPSSSSSTARSP